MKGSAIRKATKQDFEGIRDWLKKERKNGKVGNFYCNLRQIEDGLKNGRLIVLLEASKPVAFCLMGTEEIAILAVKENRRKRGAGTQLAKHCIEQARNEGLVGLIVECAPLTSIPFWKRMGFTPVPSPSAAYRMAIRLPRSLKVPDGARQFLRIQLLHDYSERPVGPPFVTQVVGDAGVYRFSDDFVEYIETGDIVISVDIEGAMEWKKKVKHAKDMGFRRPLTHFVQASSFTRPVVRAMFEPNAPSVTALR